MPGEAVPVGLLTGSTPTGRAADLRGKLASGELALIVGTHALIEEAVQFARLGLAVVDEQHRFGVRQRAALDAKGADGLSPHLLHMTATPIPRTLALAAYGDLDFTLLRELPRGRRPIQTFVCATTAERERAYDRIREELRDGRQAFVVCPLVEESELLQARAATVEFERLRGGEFADFEVVLLHGQMPSSAKQRAMATFASGQADVLVATSVIEVGIDVPNATVMLVEDADRYGISQLHQLRGRIGRGEHPSLCLLFGTKDSPRLRALASYGDGFRLAEIDLELRGEGELIGTRQHGQVVFKVAEFPRDAELLERAAHQARAPARCRPSPGAARARAPARSAAASLWRGGRGADPGMRVIGGRLGGRPLVAPRGRGTRPTPERVREALFSILGSVEDERVLDLFAGSGALGIEALSRGAGELTLVDSARSRHRCRSGATCSARNRRRSSPPAGSRLPRAGTAGAP